MVDILNLIKWQSRFEFGISLQRMFQRIKYFLKADVSWSNHVPLPYNIRVEPMHTPKIRTNSHYTKMIKLEIMYVTFK